MVGSPKRLTDLRRINASLRVTCRACGNVRDVDREQLIADLLRRGRSLDWGPVPRALRCGCGSKDAQLLIIPFGEQEHPAPAELVRFIAATEVMIEAAWSGQTNVESLSRLAAARLEYQEAKRALVAWAMI
jgi:hypothetical protein